MTDEKRINSYVEFPNALSIGKKRGGEKERREKREGEAKGKRGVSSRVAVGLSELDRQCPSSRVEK